VSKAKGKATSVKQSSVSLFKQRETWKADLVFILVIILLAFAIRYVSLTDNGITFDEPIYTLFGMDYIDNLVHLSFNGQDWAKNIEHPPVSKYIYGAAAYIAMDLFPTHDAYVGTKLASALMGVLTCVLVYLIGRDFLDRKTGFAAAILLALLPTFLAHTQIAALESPLALFVTLAMYLYMLALKNESKILFLASAVAFGLVISTKYNGLIILPVMAGFYLIYRLSQMRVQKGRLDLATLKSNLGTLVRVESGITFLGVAILLFFALWPLLWSGPIDHLQQSLGHWTYPITEYFLGAQVTPPIYYFAVYFLVTLPALLFLPLVIGTADAIRSRNPFKLALLLWFIVPFAYNFSSFIQDGIRYIFIIYPAVALLCAIGMVRAADWIGKVAGARFAAINATRVFWTLTALTLVYLLITIASVYPYYLDYYNEFTGGPKNVLEHRLFEIGWWGEGIKECMGWVGETAPSDATVIMLTLPEDTANTRTYIGDQFYIYPWLSDINGTDKVYTFSREPFMMPLDNGKMRPVEPDYIIYNQKMRDDFNVTISDPGYTLVYQATVQGAPLAQVYKKNY